MTDNLQQSAARKPGFPAIVGYHRDSNRRWRYDADNALVPGARDLTLSCIYRFRHVGGEVFVPQHAIEADSRLQWCGRYPTKDGFVGQRTTTFTLVPEDDWLDHANESLGIDAPELAPQYLMDTTRLAQRLGIAPATVRAYVVRGYLPPPTVRGLSSPLWTVPIVARHLKAKRIRQRELATRLPPVRRRRRSAAHTPLEDFDAFLERIDADLARLGIDVDDDL